MSGLPVVLVEMGFPLVQMVRWNASRGQREVGSLITRPLRSEEGRHQASSLSRIPVRPDKFEGLNIIRTQGDSNVSLEVLSPNQVWIQRQRCGVIYHV